MRIQILPSQVIDQIAAGEVVDRPAHMVKELVENSLDAGAKKLQIEYWEGGRRVKVTDDGCGLSKDELSLALERFATSKIQVAEDLWKLSTFGFRGEALASLAAVSRLTLVSRQPGDSAASQLISDFGKRSSVESVGGAPGTSILVERLFENIPARLKFLKSESAEHTQIRQTLKALALSRPDVEFHLHENGRLLAFYPKASGYRERAEQVLEMAPLYEGFAQRENFRAQAIFAAPSQIAKTSRQIWLFAQGRWIQDRGMQAAVLEAYRNLLMHGEFPIAAVWLECDPADIDVNIHPTKSQVKFRDPSLAFRAVQGSLRTRLEEAPWVPRTASPQAKEPVSGSVGAELEGLSPVHFALTAENLKFDDAAFGVTVSRKKDFDLVREPVDVVWPKLENMAPFQKASASETIAATTAGTVSAFWSSLEVLGQAKLTYILCQNSQGLVLVDQHAAHERVVFERLMIAWKGGKIDIQEFLFPVAVSLSADLVEALALATDDLARLGVSLEILGPQTVGVRAGPSLLKDSVYSSVLEKMAKEMSERGGSFSFEKIVGDLCATMACHSVVRAGQALSTEQMKNLLREMDEFPLSSFCPHGRPVSVEMPWSTLEKQFGRIP